jgi:hypothetical protein
MRRQDKYPDTKTFHYFNANPKGRITGDCRIRAIATATGVDYNKVVMALAIIQIETGYDQCADTGINILMERLGWKKMPQPRKKNGKKYTGAEFCRVQQKWLQDEANHGNEWDDGIVISPRIFCNIGGHHEVAIVDGKVWDIWDSTGGCIGNYWIKEGA